MLTRGPIILDLKVNPSDCIIKTLSAVRIKHSKKNARHRFGYRFDFHITFQFYSGLGMQFTRLRQYRQLISATRINTIGHYTSNKCNKVSNKIVLSSIALPPCEGVANILCAQSFENSKHNLCKRIAKGIRKAERSELLDIIPLHISKSVFLFI